MALTKVVRQFLPPDILPTRVRVAPAGSIINPATVTVKMGEGAQGIIVNINYSISIKRYMTKQQREISDPDADAE